MKMMQKIMLLGSGSSLMIGFAGLSIALGSLFFPPLMPLALLAILVFGSGLTLSLTLGVISMITTEKSAKRPNQIEEHDASNIYHKINKANPENDESINESKNKSETPNKQATETKTSSKNDGLKFMIRSVSKFLSNQTCSGKMSEKDYAAYTHKL